MQAEASAPSGLQGEDHAVGRGKAVRKVRKKKDAIPTQKPVLQYSALRNDQYFVG